MPNRHKQKIKLVFMISSNLREWAGMEHVLREYVSNRSEKVDIAIVQPVDAEYKRVSEGFIKENFNHVKIISIRYPFSNFNFMKKTRFGFLFVEAIIMPILGFLNKYILNRNFFSQIGEPDIIYFFNKSDASLYFKGGGRVLLVGSDHAQSLRVTDLFKAIQIKLIKNRLILRNIDVFHLFPQSDDLSGYIKSFVLPNGVDTRRFAHKAEKSETVRLLFLARLEECKGVPLVLEIWKQIRLKAEVELNIVGSGRMEGVIRSIKDRNFKYFGYVEEEKLPELISQCDIFIYPSTCDTYALVILQALSHGLYVITNEMIASSFSEFVKIGQLKVVENKPSSYIEAIIHYLENGIVFDLNVSRTICVNEYDWKVISEKLYNTLLFEYYRKTGLNQ